MIEKFASKCYAECLGTTTLLSVLSEIKFLEIISGDSECYRCSRWDVPAHKLSASINIICCCRVLWLRNYTTLHYMSNYFNYLIFFIFTYYYTGNNVGKAYGYLNILSFEKHYGGFISNYLKIILNSITPWRVNFTGRNIQPNAYAISTCHKTEVNYNQ